MSDLPKRVFSADVPQFKQNGGVLPDTEDTELTAFLDDALQEIYSKSEVPPPCPFCKSTNTGLASRPHARLPLPSFLCRTCRLRQFNRVTGTPLMRLRAAKLPAFIHLLSQQMSYAEAMRRLGVDYTAVENWTKKFRTWLLQLDPSGKWEARVRLGIKVRPHIQCPYCGLEGEKHFSAFLVGQRAIRCPDCNRRFGLKNAETMIQKPAELKIFYEPSSDSKIVPPCGRRPRS
ncbi:DUF746 domain-containing protein [Collimonas sp. PA-H2]|uniref:DUF746 domain-containing protein n=1 Tax=Collimonas sp. PA-H2 TaxID=1881062 RepID=UPI000BF40CC7|nr:DUF746 domain-containing protein [Collimonas sp. PA-H2]